VRAKNLAVTTTLLMGFCLFTTGLVSYGQEDHGNGHSTETTEAHHDEAHEEEFNPSTFALDHVKDTHDWHILTTKEGHHISVPLPVIVYSKNSGLHAFFSNKDIE